MNDIVPLREYLEALRAADLRFHAALREADQRALSIKEVGDAKALDLAREIQAYKDERDNRLREQINTERGLYVARTEFKPVAEFVTAQQGGSKVWNYVIGIALALAGFIVAWLLRGGQ
jgi:hypothetical protein